MKRLDKKNTKDLNCKPGLSEKEREVIYGEYFKNLKLWSKWARKLIDNPIITKEFNLNIKEMPFDKKETIINSHEFIDFLYIKTRIDIRADARKDIRKEKYNFKLRLCAAYAGFVATFAKLLNPKNDVIIYFGTANIIKSPYKEEINKPTEHFWVTINGKLFDNSNVDKYSYADYKSIFKTEDIVSGKFKLKTVKN